MKRDLLFPRGSLDGKSNFRRYFYVDHDGSISEKVYLNILDKRERERIICLHFIKFNARHFLKDTISVNILARDTPWDFKVEISTGDKFNLEIVSIADNQLQFKALSREEELDKNSSESEVKLRLLRKFADGFPSDELDQQVKERILEGRGPSDLVSNPFRETDARIFVGVSQPPHGLLHERIGEAIDKKGQKKNLDKENTILIIDNRTSTRYVDEVEEALDQLTEPIGLSPFKEIWFYTGYCSDLDANNEEFTMISVKVPEEKASIFSSD